MNNYGSGIFGSGVTLWLIRSSEHIHAHARTHTQCKCLTSALFAYAKFYLCTVGHEGEPPNNRFHCVNKGK